MNIQPVPITDVLKMRQEVMYPELSIEDVRLADDDAGEHFGLYDDNRLVTIVSLFNRNNRLQFRKLATLAAAQGKGYGRKMMNWIIQKAIHDKADAVWCNARVQVASFYYLFGMKEVGEAWVKHGIEFIKMEKKLS